jgi:endonuclease YncB( thermonuclease family)
MRTPPSRRHVAPLVAVLLVVLGALSACHDRGVSGLAASPSKVHRPQHVHRHPHRHPHRDAGGHRQPGKVHHRGPAPHRSPKPTKPAPRTYLVTRVVDGDTLEVGTGEIVRLVGIDTPEVGECGYEPASANLRRLVLGRRVRLTVSDEDRDRYGRLLRYVDVGPVDAGLRQIQQGYAVARYDSRDGYGYHPRENRYIAADQASPDYRCPRAPAPLVGRGCAPGYHPCIPPYPPDLDCSDVHGPIRVTGPDPHGLDADHDGVACE